MGNTVAVSTDEQLIATSKESLISAVAASTNTIDSNVLKVSSFDSEPNEGYPMIEGFKHTIYYLLDEESGYRYNILTRDEDDDENSVTAVVVDNNVQQHHRYHQHHQYYYITRLYTDRKLDRDVRERLEEERIVSEQFPNLMQKVEFHNATLKLDEKMAALFKIGSDEGNSFMSLFSSLNGGGFSSSSYYNRVRLVSSAILNVVKLFELTEGKYCFHPIDISHIVVQENLNVRFFDCLHKIADKNNKRAIFQLGLQTICKIGVCVLTHNEALYDRYNFDNRWLSDIPIPVFSSLFNKVLLLEQEKDNCECTNNLLLLDNDGNGIGRELKILELLTMQKLPIIIDNIDIFRDLVNVYASLLSHHRGQSDPFHDPFIQYLTQLITSTITNSQQQHPKEYHTVLLECNENSSLCTLMLKCIFKRDRSSLNYSTNISERIIQFSNIFKGVYCEKQEELTEMISIALVNSRKYISNDFGVSNAVEEVKSFIVSLFSSNNLNISEEEIDKISRKIFT